MKKILILLVISTIFLYTPISNLSQEKDMSSLSNCENEMKINQPSNTNHSTFYIAGNAHFDSQAASEGWKGLGTVDEPYIIEHYNISSSSSTPIYIANTTYHFIIRYTNLNVLGAATLHGIHL